MANTFDERVVAAPLVALARSLQQRAPCVLGGGAVLSGIYLRHRLSRDLDVFCTNRDDLRVLVTTLPDVAEAAGFRARIVRDAGTFVRAVVESPGTEPTELDIVLEHTRPVEPPVQSAEGVTVAALADLRASKVTCLLSRSEPRDLVDVMFLERAGFPPENDLQAALTKDGGVDPAILAWLLKQFPVTPLPLMLASLTTEELTQYRDTLAERFAVLAIPNQE